MNTKRYESITKERAEEVLNRVRKTLETYEDYQVFMISRVYDIVFCGLLLKMKRESRIQTLEDFKSNAVDREQKNYPTLMEDELVVMITDSEKNWEMFKSLVDEFDEEELVAAILTARYVERDDPYFKYVFMPRTFSKLAGMLLDIKDGDEVLSLRTSSFVFDYKKEARKANYTVFEEDKYPLISLASCVADALGYSDVPFVSEMDENRLFDKIFINNPLSSNAGDYRSNVVYELGEQWPEFPNELSAEWNYCAYALRHLKEDGKIVAVMGLGHLTGTKYTRIRQMFCQKGYVEAVVLLPEKLFSDIWASPCLLILSKNNKHVKFLDARDQYVVSRQKGKRLNVLLGASIYTIEKSLRELDGCDVVELESIDVNDYSLSPIRYKSIVTSAEKTVKLGDVVKDIKRGISLPARDKDKFVSDETSDVKCLRPLSIAGNVISSYSYYQEDVKRPGKNTAYEGDVLITKTGNPFNVAVSNDTYLVVGNVYILDVDRSKIKPEYLRCFLCSETGQQELSKYTSGAATPMISVANLMEVEIPIFDFAKQTDMEIKAERLVKKMQECTDTLAECRQKLDKLFE